MDKVACGEFVKSGDYIFRTEAKIKWGTSDELLGLIILLNPGSSKLEDKSKWTNFVGSTKNIETVSDNIILDDTMVAITDIMEKSYPGLDGVLVIHNLFNLRDPESEEAMSTYKNLFDKRDKKSLFNNFNQCIKEQYREYLHTEIPESYIKEFPWIWLAWTVSDGMILNARRKILLNNIPNKMKCFVVNSKQECHQKNKELYTYHVRPRNPKDREIYFNEIIKQMG